MRRMFLVGFICFLLSLASVLARAEAPSHPIDDKGHVLMHDGDPLARIIIVEYDAFRCIIILADDSRFTKGASSSSCVASTRVGRSFKILEGR